MSDKMGGDGDMCVRGQVVHSGVEGRGMELHPLGDRLTPVYLCVSHRQSLSICVQIRTRGLAITCVAQARFPSCV